ncbi:hypothetical protein DFH06DRAFT_687537 [Mycena polygramma]|nr:hypothetical protein DFH06DRAFT_687537 [Mycena polygramma]
MRAVSSSSTAILSPHVPAYDWGHGSEIRFKWAEVLTKGKFSTTHAIRADDIIVQGLFAQLNVQKHSRPHEPEQMSLDAQITAGDIENIRELFESAKPHLLKQSQTLKELLRQTDLLATQISMSLRAYCILLAPWSTVQLRIVTMRTTQGHGFGIVAAKELQKGEYIYELCGSLSTDFHEQHSNLSVTTSPTRKTPHVLFGPLRLVNHRCKSNAEYVAVKGCRMMIAAATKKICAGEEIVVDYGVDFFDNLCPCIDCQGHLPVKPKGEPGRREVNVEDQRKAKHAKSRIKKARKKERMASSQSGLAV